MFQGFSQATGDFLWGLSMNNDREWFDAHLKEAHPSCSVFDLACMAVNSQAPSFYLTPKSMKEIICRIKRKWYDKNNRYRISSPRTNAGNQSSMQPSIPLQEKAL